jgi:hypothetical protein
VLVGELEPEPKSARAHRRLRNTCDARGASLRDPYLFSAYNERARQSNEIECVARRKCAGHDADDVAAVCTSGDRQLECNTVVALFGPHDERVVRSVSERRHVRALHLLGRVRALPTRAYAHAIIIAYLALHVVDLTRIAWEMLDVRV